MYVIVVGAGKVGLNLGRELRAKGHEVTLVESDPSRFAAVEEEFEHNAQYGDGSELWVSSEIGGTVAIAIAVVAGSRPALRPFQLTKPSG